MPPAQILVIDDSLTMRKMVEMILARDGLTVRTCRKGQDGLELLREQPPLPDLILLDYILPDMRGAEFCQEMQSIPGTRGIPVILVSANGQVMRQLYQEIPHVVDYLTKPFAADALRTLVTQTLADTSAAASTANPAAPAPKPAFDLLRNPPPPQRPEPLDLRPSELAEALTRRLRDALTQQTDRFRPRLDELLAYSSPDAWPPALREHFTSTSFLDDLSRRILETTGLLLPSELELQLPASLLPGRDLLPYLARRQLSGALAINDPRETVILYFQRGEIIFITSDQPDLLLDGLDFPLDSFTPDQLALARQNQRDTGKPSFLSLHEIHHPEDNPEDPAPHAHLPHLLRQAGENSAARALNSGLATLQFERGDGFPEFVLHHRHPYSLHQLLLVAHRASLDWTEIERELPTLDTPVAPAPYLDHYLPQLDLIPSERRLLRALTTPPVSPDAPHTVQSLADISTLSALDTCRILHSFLRIGLATLAKKG